MKKLIAVLLSGVFLSAVGISAAANDPKEEKQVAATMETMAKATVNKDLATLDKVYHEDLTYGHSTGAVQTKAEILKAVSGPAKVQSLAFRDTTIRIYGSVALFKGITEQTTASGDKVNEVHWNILWVLVKAPETPQGWQIVARQATALAKPAP
jgi:hypothetical protein